MMMPGTPYLSVRHFNCCGKDEMTSLQEMGEQPLTPDSLVPIILKRVDGWDQVASFVTLTMHRKMEIAQEWQRRHIAATTQHPMPDFAIPPPLCLPSATQQQKKKTIQACLPQRHLAAFKTQA